MWGSCGGQIFGVAEFWGGGVTTWENGSMGGLLISGVALWGDALWGDALLGSCIVEE